MLIGHKLQLHKVPPLKKKTNHNLINTGKKNTILAIGRISGNTTHLVRTEPRTRHYSCDEHPNICSHFFVLTPKYIWQGDPWKQREQELNDRVRDSNTRWATPPSGDPRQGTPPQLTYLYNEYGVARVRAGTRTKRCGLLKVLGKMDSKKTDHSSRPSTR